jgi:hypothetical protein
MWIRSDNGGVTYGNNSRSGEKIRTGPDTGSY